MDRSPCLRDRVGSKLSVCVFPLLSWDGWLEHVPMLNDLAVGDPIEIVKGRGLVIEKPFICDEHETALTKNFVDFVNPVDKAGLRKRASFGLEPRLVIFTIAIVLMKPVPVLDRLIALFSDDHDIEVFF